MQQNPSSSSEPQAATAANGQPHPAAAPPLSPPASAASSTSSFPELEEKIIASLRTIYDPEIPVNIYDLGLIYKINIDPEKNINIDMTLTAPGCPVAGTLVMMVESQVNAIDEVKSAAVNLVWDPPWSRERMSEAALLQLGLV